MQNSLAAIGVALEFGVSIEVIREALASFGGVKRRLEIVGTEAGVTVMSDYGHHPTEIRATLRAIKECFGSSISRLVVLFQPHRFSRTKMCWEEYLTCFRDADKLVLTEVYAASELPIEGVSGEALSKAVSHSEVSFLPLIEDAPERIASSLQSGDLLLCLGAGSVGSMPEKFLQALRPDASGALRAEGA